MSSRLIGSSINSRADFNRKMNRIKQIPQNSYRFFKRTTPIDTGNARRKTNFRGQTIYGEYPYVNRLNEGYSRQAPDGMTEPTIADIRRQVKKILGK